VRFAVRLFRHAICVAPLNARRGVAFGLLIASGISPLEDPPTATDRAQSQRLTVESRDVLGWTVLCPDMVGG
jgi:hypothetical protein